MFRKSSTQFSEATVCYDENVTFFESHFSFPLDFQFYAKKFQDSKKLNCKYSLILVLTHVSDGETDALATRPYILFQVNSVDSWNRYRIEGYGFLRLPFEDGFHEITVQTWKPKGSLNTEVHSFFLGGSVRILRMDELIKSHYLTETVRNDS